MYKLTNKLIMVIVEQMYSVTVSNEVAAVIAVELEAAYPEFNFSDEALREIITSVLTEEGVLW